MIEVAKLYRPGSRGHLVSALSHARARTRAAFDDSALVAHAGLASVTGPAERAGLHELMAEFVRPGGDCGVNAPAKVGCLVAGMAAGAGSVDDKGLLLAGLWISSTIAYANSAPEMLEPPSASNGATSPPTR